MIWTYCMHVYTTIASLPVAETIYRNLLLSSDKKRPATFTDYFPTEIGAFAVETGPRTHVWSNFQQVSQDCLVGLSQTPSLGGVKMFGLVEPYPP